MWTELIWLIKIPQIPPGALINKIKNTNSRLRIKSNDSSVHNPSAGNSIEDGYEFF